MGWKSLELIELIGPSGALEDIKGIPHPSVWESRVPSVWSLVT